ncbi:adenylate cyclase [Methylocella silvestris]|uniref:adenylate cyclase n=1 Tax=Methylocella silvestris TaxID=199596 RepID=UPI001FDECB5D|nr:adenylate cyclase [Methylocella silvestris]
MSSELAAESEGPGSALSPESVLAQLDRILSSPEFQLPERGRSFLRYIVSESLAGRAQRIKAYTIAIEVFGREEGFSQEDPVVRIEASRLRRALERYYLIAGQSDPIRIDMPKGGYVPTFATQLQCAKHAPPEALPPGAPPDAAPNVAAEPERRSGAQKNATALIVFLGLLSAGYWLFHFPAPLRAPPDGTKTGPQAPVLAVAPFADLGEGPLSKLYALGLREELLTDLPRFKELRVLGRETSKALPAEAEAAPVLQKLGVGYMLTGAVRVADDRLRVTARLLEADKGEILWSQSYEQNLSSGGLFAIQADIAGKVASAVAQPYGVIAQADVARSLRQPPDDPDAYFCTLHFYIYRAQLSPEKHAAARDCLESAIKRFPDYATAFAMLSIIYLDEDRFLYNPRPGAPAALERSLAAARRAVELDPANVRAQQALMTTLNFNQRLAESLEVGEQALALNPNDTELMGEFGTRLALSGQWERGKALLSQALSRNPGGSAYYRGMLAIVNYIEGDDRQALIDIRQSNLQAFPLYHLIAAVVYAQNGLDAEARTEADAFVKMNPKFIPNVDAELIKRNIGRDDRAHMIAGMRKAGLTPPPDAGAPGH